MTNKEFIKLFLIAIGCDKKYEIETYKADDGSTVYDVYGEDFDDNRRISVQGFGMYDTIIGFLNTIKENPDIDLLDNLNYSINHLPLKYLLDDKERNNFYIAQQKSAEETQKYLEDTKYIKEYVLPYKTTIANGINLIKNACKYE